jgi:hypothetical protein
MVSFLSNVLEQQNVADVEPCIQGLALEQCITVHADTPGPPVYV